MVKDVIGYNGKEYQISTVYIENMATYETMVFPIEDDVVSGREVYCFRTDVSSESQNKHKDILYNPEKYLSEEAIKQYSINKGYLIPKTNFMRLQSMDIDELAEWLDKNGMWDNSPWSKWFDEEYCKKCEDIMCKSPDDSRQFRCAYCEIYDKCRFFDEMEDVPDCKDIIKMWREAEVE